MIKPRKPINLEELRTRTFLDWNDFEALIIVAPPKTLGEMRKHYHKEVSQRLKGELDKDLTGHPIPVVSGDRRPGDPAVLVASSARAEEVLGWRQRYAELSAIVETAWSWHRRRFD